MRAHEVETWALRVIDDVLEGRPNEDSRVELKREWPDVRKAARAIAGHANASRGASILWLIGVDEKGREVVGAEKKEFADWFPQVASCFDGVAPDLFDYNIPSKDKIVVALLFGTERLPFVIKNPDGGQISREVPWREGTKTISITRENLLRILSPDQIYPSFDFLSGEVSFEKPGSRNGKYRFEFYAETISTDRIVIPFYRCEFAVLVESTELSTETKNLKIVPAPVSAQEKSPQTISSTLHDVSLTGPGYLNIHGTFSLRGAKPEEVLKNTRNIHARFRLWPVYAMHPLIVDCRLEGSSPLWKGSKQAHWVRYPRTAKVW